MQKIDSFSQNVSHFKEARIKDYIALLKPGVMSLAVFTAFVGMLIAPDGQIGWVLKICSILCIALGAGAAGTFNMAYEAPIDARMKRTALRPIPRGVVSKESAWILGGILSVLSIMGLMLTSNILAAGLLAFSIFFYSVVYTIFLKKRTDQNIVIGGVAGALPPVIGWAAATGSLDTPAWLLFLIIFFWTPPHFWALALYKSEDYRKVGIPVLPLTAGIKSTCLHILFYSVLLVVLGVSPVFTGFAGWIYGLISVGMGLFFVSLCGRLCCAGIKGEGQNIQNQKLNRAAKNVFSFSILYLFVLFLVLLLEHSGVLGFLI